MKYKKILEKICNDNIESKILINDIINYYIMEEDIKRLLNKNFSNYLLKNKFYKHYIFSLFFFDIDFFIKKLNKEQYEKLFMKNNKVIDCTSENLGIGEIKETKYDSNKGLIYIIEFENSVIRELQPSDIDYL